MADVDWDSLLRACRGDNEKAVYDLGERYGCDARGVAARTEAPVPAAAIRRAILEEARATPVKRDFRLNNCVIDRTLHLEHVQFRGYLRFENCCFLGRIDLRHARLRRLKFVNCVFEEIVEADVAEVDGDVEFRDCQLKKGLVFRAARVGGRFVVEGTQIEQIKGWDRDDVTSGAALDAAMLHADHGMSFRRSETRATSLRGGLDLTLAGIGGNLEFRGASLDPCKEQPAVDLTNGTVRGFLFIREETVLAGKLNLFSAKVQLFSIDNSTITCGKCGDYAIDAEEVTVATSFTLGDGAAVEAVNLNSAHVGGVFQFGGSANESGDTGPALTTERKPPAIAGRLNLAHARIGRLSIDFQTWLELCGAERMMPLFNGCIYDDIVSINGHDSVHKDALSKWIQTIRDDGDGDGKEKKPVTRWTRLANLSRLSTDSTHHPQIYHQLISVLRAKGREVDARRIEQLNSVNGVFARYNKRFLPLAVLLPFSWFRRWLTGYGHSIQPLLWVSLIFVTIMSFYYQESFEDGAFMPANPVLYTQGEAAGGAPSPAPGEAPWTNPSAATDAALCVAPAPAPLVVPADVWPVFRPFFFQTYEVSYMRPEYTSFHPFLYSLDVFLPIVSLSQDTAWAPKTPAGEWSWPWFWVVTQILLGWIFSGLLLAFVSGIIRRRP